MQEESLEPVRVKVKRGGVRRERMRRREREREGERGGEREREGE